MDELPDLLPRAAELDRAACRADVEDRFSTERMVAEHLQLYQDLLAHSYAPVDGGAEVHA